MATLFRGWGCQGESKDFGVGTYFNVEGASLRVGAKEVVKFYHHIESSDANEGSMNFYEGEYPIQAYFYEAYNKWPRMEVAECKWTKDQLIWCHYDDNGELRQVPFSLDDGLVNLTEFPYKNFNDKFSRVIVPEGLEVKLFKDALENPTLVSSTPGIEIVGAKNLMLETIGYYGQVSELAIGGSKYKLLSVEIDEANADWEAYTTIGGKQRAENNTPLENAAVTVAIGYTESNSQTQSWEAGFGAEFSNETQIGNDASFVKTTFGVTLSVNASFGGEDTDESSQETSIEGTATLNPWSACDIEAVLEMKKGEVPAVRRYVNMKSGTVVEEKGKIEFDMFADATTRIANYVELRTPERAEYASRR